MKRIALFLLTVLFTVSVPLYSLAETRHVGMVPIDDGRMITSHFTWFETDRNDVPYIYLKVNGTGYDEYGGNVAVSEEFFFQPWWLTVERDRSNRRVIKYGDTVCARQWRVFKNYRKRDCEIRAEIHRIGERWWWIVDLIVKDL